MPLMVVMLVAAVLTFTALALGGLIVADRRRRRHQARLMRARRETDTRPNAEPRLRKRRADPAGRLLTRVERQMAQSGLQIGLSSALMKLSIGVLAIYAGAVLGLGLHPLLAVPLALVVPVMTALLVLRIAKARYRAAFTVGLPEALDVFARGLRAGRPVADSLAIVVENAKGPVAREFARCRDEMRLGNGLAETLDRLSLRLPTSEVSFFAVSTALQSETGGNLIETMESLAAQLRERRKLRRKARALSSEARASALILAALPFAVGVLLAVLNFAYLAPLFSDPRGQVMALLAVVSIGLGILLMVRMGKLDV